MNQHSLNMIERAKEEVKDLTPKELYRELNKFIELCDHLNPLTLPWTLDINEIALRENMILSVLSEEFVSRIKRD